VCHWCVELIIQAFRPCGVCYHAAQTDWRITYDVMKSCVFWWPGVVPCAEQWLANHALHDTITKQSEQMTNRRLFPLLLFCAWSVLSHRRGVTCWNLLRCMECDVERISPFRVLHKFVIYLFLVIMKIGQCTHDRQKKWLI